MSNRRVIPESEILALHAEGVDVSVIAYKLGTYAPRVRRVIARTRMLTPLQQRTTDLHAACKAMGGCEPSDHFVLRQFAMGAVELPECRRCKVPIRGMSRLVMDSWKDSSAIRWKEAAGEQ